MKSILKGLLVFAIAVFMLAFVAACNRGGNDGAPVAIVDGRYESPVQLTLGKVTGTSFLPGDSIGDNPLTRHIREVLNIEIVIDWEVPDTEAYINKVIALGPHRLYPATGPIINNPKKDCMALLSRTEWVFAPPTYRSDAAYALTNYTPIREFGRYKEVVPGIFQNNNHGNMVLYVNKQGHGLLIDPYPCNLPWYSLPFASLSIDRIIEYEVPFKWQGISVLPIHTPGHCYAHAGFVLDWNGIKTVTTGDTLQYGNGPIKVGLPIMFNNTSWPRKGFIATFKRLLSIKPELVLGGHSFSFFDDGILADWYNAANDSQALAEAMLVNGDTMKAMTPPVYDATLFAGL